MSEQFIRRSVASNFNLVNKSTCTCLHSCILDFEIYKIHNDLQFYVEFRKDFTRTMPCYDMRCYLDVRAKADMSQLNLPHEPTTKKWKTEKN